MNKNLRILSQKIDVSKNQETLLKLYDTSITPLVEQYIEKCELLERFYVKSRFNLWIDNTSSHSEKSNIIKNSRTIVNDKIKSIKLEYKYESFNQIGFKEFNLNTNISFQFHLTRYMVKNTNSKAYYEKLYGEQLTAEEITNLVTTDIRMHKEVIENQIKNIK